MVSVASTSATMDLTAVLPALMEGIAQEFGVDMNELKVVLVGDETQLDVKPFLAPDLPADRILDQ